MYGIEFELSITKLKKYFGEAYGKAYDEIRLELNQLGFRDEKSNVFINDNKENSLAAIYKSIDRLSKINWFSESIIFLNVFRIEEISNFTNIIKNKRA